MTTKLLTAADFHAAGGRTPKTQANWRVLGKGPKFIKVGTLVRYDVRDVETWLSARRVGSTSERVAA